jgi:hypothetical protein
MGFVAREIAHLLFVDTQRQVFLSPYRLVPTSPSIKSPKADGNIFWHVYRAIIITLYTGDTIIGKFAIIYTHENVSGCS